MRSLDVSLYRATPVDLVSRDLGYSCVTCLQLAYSYVSVSVSRDFYVTGMSHGDLPRLFLCHAYVFSLMPLTHLR